MAALSAIDESSVGMEQKLVWQAYGLSHDPFADDDNVTYFTIPEWEKEFELLAHMAQFSNVLIAVTGKRGGGKTVFHQTFQHRVEDKVEVHQINAQSSIDSSQLLSIISEAYSLPDLTSVDKSLENKLAQQVTNLQHASRNCLLIIDDAHRLPQMTLATLMNLVKLQAKQQVALHIMLVSEPSLSTTLSAVKAQASGDIKTVVHHVALAALKPEQIPQYLEFRLNLAGFTDVFPFSQDEIENIFKSSNGIIADINVMARSFLIEHVHALRTQRTFAWQRYRYPLVVGTAGLMAVAFTLVGLALFNYENGLQKGDVQRIPIRHPSTDIMSLFPAQDSFVIQPKVVVKQNPPEINRMESKPIKIVNKPARNEVLPPPPAVQPLAPPQDMVMLDTDPTEEQTINALNEARKHYIKPKSPVVVDRVVVVPQPKKVNVVKEDTMNPTSESSDIGLQILGTYDKQALKLFIKRHKLDSRVIFYQTKNKGRDWYVLMYGKYQTVKEARKAADELPSALKKMKPWPRSLVNLQPASSKT